MADAPRQTDPRRAIEADTVDVRRVLLTAMLAGAVIVICALGVSLLAHNFAARFGGRPPSSAALVPPVVPGPALQPAPAADLQALRADERLKLRTYRWIDRPHGVVQVPVERAMELLAQRHAVAGPSK